MLADLELLGDFVVKHQGRPPPAVLREAAVELSPTAASRWWSTQTVIRVGCFRSIATSSRRRDRRATDVLLERLPVFGLPRCLPYEWRPASRRMNASDASTPVEFGEERRPQLDELVLWVIQHRKKRLAVLGRECNEVAVECDGIQQGASCAIGAVPCQLRREFECLLAGDTGAGNYRHGRRILRDQHRRTDWVSRRSIASVCLNTSTGEPVTGASHMLGLKDAAKIGKRVGGRPVLERAPQRAPFDRRFGGERRRIQGAYRAHRIRLLRWIGADRPFVGLRATHGR